MPIRFEPVTRFIAWGGGSLTNVPAELTNIMFFSTGGEHCLCVKDDGSIMAWGGNSHSESTIPADLTNTLGIAAGFYHNLAIKADRTVAAWGRAEFGQTQVPCGVVERNCSCCGEQSQRCPMQRWSCGKLGWLLGRWIVFSA